jgi:competence protein ComEA
MTKTLRTMMMVVACLMAVVPAASAQAPAAPAVAKATAVDLNTASIAELESLPGIGRRTAERIVEHRQKSGGFKKIEELMNVRGIGEKSFLRLKPLIAVAPKAEKAGDGR